MITNKTKNIDVSTTPGSTYFRRTVVEFSSALPSDHLLSAFPRRICLAATDGHSSNTLAEFWIERDTQWSSLHTLDPAHKIAMIATKAMEINPSFVSGIINYSLVLRGPGALMAQRRALKMILRDKLVIKKGQPSPAAVEFRQNMINAFGGGHRKPDILKTLVTQRLLNGDWRSKEEVQHFEYGCCPGGRSQTLRKMMKLVPRTFLQRKPKGEALRKNFTGAHEALNLIGLFQACHGLAEQSFVLAFPPPRRSQNSAQPWHGGAAVEDLDAPLPLEGAVAAGAGDAEMDLGGDGSDGEFAADGGGIVAASEGVGPAPSFGEAQADQVRREREATRMDARSFITRANSLDEMYINQQILKLEDVTMKAVMRMAGERWELLQQAKAANGEKRSFKISELGKGAIFKQFSADLHGLWWNDVVWSHVARTPSSASRVFRAFSKSGAASYELNEVRCRRWPSPLFDIAGGDADNAIAKLQQASNCVLDSYTRGLKRRFSSMEGGLKHPDLAAEVEFLAHEVDPITLSTERMHSYIRRHCKRRQTTPISLSLASAFQTARNISGSTAFDDAIAKERAQSLAEGLGDDARPRHRRISAKARRRASAKSKSGGGPGVIKKPAAAKRGGGGGMQRAFFMMHGRKGTFAHIKDKKARFTAMHAALKETSQEEREQLARIGHLGTVAHRVGSSSTFGERALLTRGSTAVREAHLELGSSKRQGLAIEPEGIGSRIVPLSSALVNIEDDSDIRADVRKQYRLYKTEDAEDKDLTIYDFRPA